VGGQITSRVPFEDYRQIDALNMSRLKEIGRSPKHYVYRAAHPLESKPLTLGKAAHCAVLEPERFDTDFVIWNKLTKNGSGNIAPQSGEQWETFKAQHVGKSIITVKERDAAMAIQQAIRAEPAAMRYLETGDPEVTMEWTMPGEQWGFASRRCKARADWLTRIDGKPYVVGLKTARDCRAFIFGSAAAKLEYPLSWSFYFDGFAAINEGELPSMKEIVVESGPPHAVVVYDIPDEIIIEGRDKYIELLKILAECETSGLWPGPAKGEQVLTLPSYYYQQHDDLAELGLVA
jgi:hypothetical protein